MTRKPGVRNLLELLQKPPEVFAGLMPPVRCLYAPRLYLRRCRKNDAPELLELLTINRAYLDRWLQPQPEKLKIADVNALIAEDHVLARRGQRLDLGIFTRETHCLIGRIAMHSVDYGIQRSTGLSYWLDEKMTGQGLMKEAIATIVSFAFEEACLHRVWLNIINQNAASLAIASRLGFQIEGVKKQSLFVGGFWRDATHLAMLDNDYEAVADQWISMKFLGI